MLLTRFAPKGVLEQLWCLPCHEQTCHYHRRTRLACALEVTRRRAFTGVVMGALKISGLEKATGVPRTTIHFYMREGLLPPPQKTGRSFAYYSDRHVDLLREILQLKERGLGLQDIRRALQSHEGALPEEHMDLMVQRDEALKSRILETAARQFAARGYRNTRVADIVTELGIGPLTLYRYFPTKRQLFLEVVNVFADWMVEYVEPQIAADPDFIKRNMRRVAGFLGLRALSPDMLGFVRAEALGEDREIRALVKRMYWQLLEPIAKELDQLGSPAGSSPAPASEFVSYAFIGVLETLMMRMSWDGKYSERDYFQTALGMLVALQALYTGEIDFAAKNAQYADMVDELTRSGPPTPPRAASMETGETRP